MTHKRERQKVITFISAFFTEDDTKSVNDCVNALKAARLDPGAGLVRTIRTKILSEKTTPTAGPKKELPPESITLLKNDPAARAASIRTLIVGMRPDSGVKEILRKCHLFKIPATRDEVMAARTQVRKLSIGALGEIAKNATVVAETAETEMGDATLLTAEESDAYLDGVHQEMLYQKAITAPVPTPFTQKVDSAAVAAQIAEERERKEKLRIEREARSAERAKEKEKQWAKEREAEAAKPPETPPEEIKAKTEELPDAIAHRFSNRLNGATTTPAELPPELVAGKQDNAEGRAVRLRWAEDFVLQQPHMHSGDVQLALQATFGIGLNSAVVQDILKTVRELNGMRYITRKRTELPPTLEAAEPQIIEVPRKAQPLPPETKVLITWVYRGAPAPQPPMKRATIGTLAQSLTELANLKVDLSTVEVYRQIKVNHETVTTVTVLAEVEDD